MSAGLAAQRLQGSAPRPVRGLASLSLRRLSLPLTLLLLLAIEVPALLTSGHDTIDLDVYRAGGSAALHATPLYGPAFAAGTPLHLAFTYPPPAALALVPLALLPAGVVGVLWLLGELAAVIAIATVAFRPFLATVAAAHGAGWALLTRAALCVAVLRMCPVNDHLGFGQIDLFLLVLVSADLLTGRPPWPRGLLIGVATAIKLVPGVFIAYLLVTGRRREAGTAAVAFAGAVGAAFLVLPQASESYWRHGVFDTSTIVVGAGARFSDQSLRGMLLRSFPHGTATALWLLLGSVLAVVGLARARRAHREGDELLAVVVVGLLGTALSPVSWIHHLVWLAPAVGVLAGAGRDHRRLAAAAVALLLLWARLPYHGDAIGQAGGPFALAEPLRSAYGLMGLALLLRLTVTPGAAEPGPARAGASAAEGSGAPPTRRATRAAKTPAPYPLSMLTVTTPGAQEDSIPASAAKPPAPTP